jgi:hypothetical protein
MPHAKRTVHIQRVGPGMTYRQKIAGPGGRAIAWTSKSPPTNSTRTIPITFASPLSIGISD